MANVMRLFETRERALLAMDGLRAAGFGEDQISYAVRDERDAVMPGPGAEIQERNEGVLSAWSGGLIGGTTGLLASAALLAIPGIGPMLVVGPILAMMGGGALGATVGGLLGESLGGDDREEQTKRFEEGLRRGDILVAVHTPDERAEEARSILEYYASSPIEVAVNHLGTERRDGGLRDEITAAVGDPAIRDMAR